MRTDITDKLTPEQRQRWLDYFEDQMALEETMASMLRAHTIQNRNLRRREQALWKEFSALYPTTTRAHVIADFETGKILLTEPGYADAKGAE